MSDGPAVRPAQGNALGNEAGRWFASAQRANHCPKPTVGPLDRKTRDAVVTLPRAGRIRPFRGGDVRCQAEQNWHSLTTSGCQAILLLLGNTDVFPAVVSRKENLFRKSSVLPARKHWHSQ